MNHQNGGYDRDLVYHGQSISPQWFMIQDFIEVLEKLT